MGIWHGAGATKSWFHSGRLKKSFVEIKKVSAQPKFSIEMGSETLGDDSQPWIGDTKKILVMRKRYGAAKYWSLVLELSSSFRFSLISHPLHLKSLYFSLPLCEGWIWLLFIPSSELKNPCLKWQSPSQIWRVKQQNHPFLANCTNSAPSSHYFDSFLDNLTGPLFLGSNVPFGRPSASVENSFVLSLFLLYLSQFCPKHNTRRRSLSMLVLSHSGTHNLNGYMAWCGCHEILIPLW